MASIRKKSNGMWLAQVRRVARDGLPALKNRRSDANQLLRVRLKLLVAFQILGCITFNYRVHPQVGFIQSNMQSSFLVMRP